MQAKQHHRDDSDLEHSANPIEPLSAMDSVAVDAQVEDVATNEGWMQTGYRWLLTWAERPGAPWMLALMSWAEAFFFPIPPDVLLLPLCLGRRRRAFFYAGICTMASVVGGMCGYALGVWGWASVAPMFFAYIPGFSPESFAKIQALYDSYGVLLVFSAGFSPIPFKLFTIASGVMELGWLSFMVAATVGRGGRFFLLAAASHRFGDRIYGQLGRSLTQWVLIGTAAIMCGFVLWKLL